MTLPDNSNPPIRLQKYLARAGVASRRKCEALIRAGVVEVNGTKVKEPFFPVLLGADQVRVEGKLLAPAKPVYYKLYKPGRVLSAMGEAALTTLEDILPPEIARIFPVGRLDYDASGLLLLTNDGDLTNLLLHPRFHVTKVYNVKLKPTPSRLQLKRLESGIDLDGVKTKPSTWHLYQKLEHDVGMVEVILTEGRKNQIKRMANSIGCHVRDLVRVKFGPILLGHLKEGQFKKLAEGEIAALKRVAKLAQAQLRKEGGLDDEDGDEGD